MRGWVEYIWRQTEQAGTSFLWKTEFHLADWLALDSPDSDSPFGGIDPYYIASAYYHYSALLTAKAARVLGKEKEAEQYAALSENIRQAIVSEYFTPEGVCKIGTQMAFVVALFMELTPPEMCPALLASLRQKLQKNGMRLDTKFVGTPSLCRALSASGANEDAYFCC